MLRTCLIFLLLIFGLHSSNVLTLTSTDFKSTIQDNEFVLVMFYSPDCGHCKDFRPEYEKLPEMLAEMKVVVGDISCLGNVEVCDEEKVNSYPTTVLYASGQKLKYENARTAEGIKKWIQNYQEKRINVVKKEELSELKVPYVLYHGKDNEIIKMLDKISFTNNHVSFYQMEEDTNKLVIMNSKNVQIVYEGEQENAKIESWILQHTLPTIIPLSKQEFVEKVFMESPLPALFVIVSSDADYEHQTHALIQDYCEEQKEKVICGQVTKQNQIYEGAHSFLRQDDINKSMVAIVKSELKVAFVCPSLYEELTKQKLNKFVDEAIEEAIDPVFDDRVPTEIDFQNVQVVKGEELDDFIKTHDYVLVNFYSPEDPPSLKLYPRYDILKAQMEEDKEVDVEIVAVDCKEFQSVCEEKLVEFYPNLRLYIKGLSVDLEQGMDVPDVPTMNSFVLSRLKAETASVEKKEEMKELPKPSILFIGPEKIDIIEIFPKVVKDIQCFYLKSEGDYHIELYTENKVIEYEGEFLIREVEEWILAESGPMLMNMMADVPDPRVINAVKNKKPIMFLLDTQKDLREQYRQNFGQICKNLKYICGYAEGEHEGFPSVAGWVGLQPTGIEKSAIIYADIGTDKKYLYPNQLDSLNQQNFKNFCESVKNGEIEEIVRKEQMFQFEEGQMNEGEVVDDGEVKEEELKEGEVEPEVEKQEEVMEDL